MSAVYLVLITILYLTAANLYVSALAVVGPKCFDNMLLGGLELDWVSNLKYLGIMFNRPTGPYLEVDASLLY